MGHTYGTLVDIGTSSVNPTSSDPLLGSSSVMGEERQSISRDPMEQTPVNTPYIGTRTSDVIDVVFERWK